MTAAIRALDAARGLLFVLLLVLGLLALAADPPCIPPLDDRSECSVPRRWP